MEEKWSQKDSENFFDFNNFASSRDRLDDVGNIKAMVPKGLAARGVIPVRRN